MRVGFIAVASVFLALSGCKKDAAKAPADPYGKDKPSIQSFVATNLCEGIVNVTGTTFDPAISEDSIYFGKVKGTIISATATQIIAAMPPVNIAGKITVYCEGRPNISKDSIFQYIPVIDSFAPLIAGTGTRITISGHGFNPDPQHDSVFFNDIRAIIFSADTNQLVAIVPPGNASGIISLHSNCRYTASARSFVLLNKGILFIGSNGSNFYSIDIASGDIRWTFPMNNSDASPIYSNGVVFIGGDPSGFYALDANTGAQLWALPTGPWGGYPTLVQDTLFAGSYDNNFYAINALNGQKIWQFHAGYDAIFTTTATYYNGAIYAGNGNGNFYCLNSATGNVNWNAFIWPFGSPTVINGNVYTSGFDSAGESNFLYAFDAGTGQVKWKSSIYELYGTPLVANGIVYVGNEEGNLFAIDALSGQQLWKSNAGPWAHFAQVAGNILYYSTSGGTLQAVDITTGNPIWSILLAPNTTFQPGAVLADGAIYVGDNSGNVHALDATSGNTIWTLHTSGAPILSSPCVVDSSGIVYYGGK